MSRSVVLAGLVGILVPRQATTGGKTLPAWHHQARQQVFTQDADFEGTRAALPTLSRSNTRLGQWFVWSTCASPSLTPSSLLLPPRWRALCGRSCDTIGRLSKRAIAV